MGNISYNILKVMMELQRPRSFIDWETKQQCGKVPDSRLQICWPYSTASAKPQILIHTHRVMVTSAVMEILTLKPLPSGVTWNVTPRMCSLLILTLCKKHNSALSFLLAGTAGLFSLPELCWAIEPHGLCLLWSHESLLRGWILSVGWHGRLIIRQLWFPSRLQGWMCARASILLMKI